jgi:uncharacterized phage-associated protein
MFSKCSCILGFSGYLYFTGLYQSAQRRGASELKIATHFSDGSTQRVANFFLEKAYQESVPLTAMKLQKLVYIAYGWHLALTDEKLFSEGIEAWQHGPVIPSLYHEFKHFKGGPITSFATSFDYDSGQEIVPKVQDAQGSTTMVLSKVWNIYKRFGGWSLREKTHEEGGPWHRVFEENKMGIELKDEDIKDHYKKRIAAYLAAASD